MNKLLSFLIKSLEKISITWKIRSYIFKFNIKLPDFFPKNEIDIAQLKFEVSSKNFPKKNYDQNIIYCIGDSHASFFSGHDEIQKKWHDEAFQKYPFFKVYWLGPVLAYNLCKLNTRYKGRELLFFLLSNNIPIGGRVLLCFGEIDCRAHLIKQSKIQKKPLKKIITKCVDRYFSVIKEIKEKGYQVMVWNVIPSVPNVKKVKNLRDFPYYGTCIERNLVTRYFNNYLKRRCEEENIFFLDVFDELVNNNKETKEEYLFDGFHLSQKAMPHVLKKLIKQFPEYKSQITNLELDDSNELKNT